jgi:hypothetical protein
MNTRTRPQSIPGIALGAFMLVVALATVGLLAGCCEASTGGSSGASGATASTFNGEALGDPVIPPAPDLTQPLPSLRSYLAWAAFAYRMANSDIASRTATPYEGVRIDSYIQLNREKGQGIEQELLAFTPVEVEASRTADAAMFTASETWRYRYFSLDKKRYISPWYTTSYEATYSVLATQGVWLVDYVEATPLTPVQ